MPSRGDTSRCRVGEILYKQFAENYVWQIMIIDQNIVVDKYSQIMDVFQISENSYSGNFCSTIKGLFWSVMVGLKGLILTVKKKL